jgi:hypothetical protein
VPFDGVKEGEKVSTVEEYMMERLARKGQEDD